MRLSLSRLLLLLAFGCTCFVPAASSAEPQPDPPRATTHISSRKPAFPAELPPDPAFPFGSSGLWFFHKGGWKLGDRSDFSMHLLCDPPLQYENVDPIGISIRNMWFQGTIREKSRLVTAGPGLCYFEGLLWTLSDQFGHSARAVMGRDQSLIGFSVRVWNNSKQHPLTLMRVPESPIFHIGLTIGKSTYWSPKKPARPQKPQEWTLQPREKQEVFVPVREILPEGFDPKESTECLFTVEVDVYPKGETKDGRSDVESPYPHVSGFAVSLTREGLAMNPKEALEEAEKNKPSLFKGK